MKKIADNAYSGIIEYLFLNSRVSILQGKKKKNVFFHKLVFVTFEDHFVEESTAYDLNFFIQNIKWWKTFNYENQEFRFLQIFLNTVEIRGSTKKFKSRKNSFT